MSDEDSRCRCERFNNNDKPETSVTSCQDACYDDHFKCPMEDNIPPYAPPPKRKKSHENSTLEKDTEQSNEEKAMSQVSKQNEEGFMEMYVREGESSGQISESFSVNMSHTEAPVENSQNILTQNSRDPREGYMEMSLRERESSGTVYESTSVSMMYNDGLLRTESKNEAPENEQPNSGMDSASHKRSKPKSLSFAPSLEQTAEKPRRSLIPVRKSSTPKDQGFQDIYAPKNPRSLFSSTIPPRSSLSRGTMMHGTLAEQQPQRLVGNSQNEQKVLSKSLSNLPAQGKAKRDEDKMEQAQNLEASSSNNLQTVQSSESTEEAVSRPRKSRIVIKYPHDLWWWRPIGTPVEIFDEPEPEPPPPPPPKKKSTASQVTPKPSPKKISSILKQSEVEPSESQAIPRTSATQTDMKPPKRKKYSRSESEVNVLGNNDNEPHVDMRSHSVQTLPTLDKNKIRKTKSEASLPRQETGKEMDTEQMGSDARVNSQLPGALSHSDSQIQTEKSPKTQSPLLPPPSPQKSDGKTEKVSLSGQAYKKHLEELPASPEIGPDTASGLSSPTYSNASLHENEENQMLSPFQEIPTNQQTPNKDIQKPRKTYKTRVTRGQNTPPFPLSSPTYSGTGFPSNEGTGVAYEPNLEKQNLAATPQNVGGNVAPPPYSKDHFPTEDIAGQPDGRPLLVDDETITDRNIESFPSDQFKATKPFHSDDNSTSSPSLGSPSRTNLIVDKQTRESPATSDVGGAQSALIHQNYPENMYLPSSAKIIDRVDVSPDMQSSPTMQKSNERLPTLQTLNEQEQWVSRTKSKVSFGPAEWSSDVPLIKEKTFPEFGRAPSSMVDEFTQSDTEVSGFRERREKQDHDTEEDLIDFHSEPILPPPPQGKSPQYGVSGENLPVNTSQAQLYPGSGSEEGILESKDHETPVNRKSILKASQPTITKSLMSLSKPHDDSDAESENSGAPESIPPSDSKPPQRVVGTRAASPSRSPFTSDAETKDFPNILDKRPATTSALSSPAYSNTGFQSNEETVRPPPFQENGLFQDAPRKRDGKPFMVDDETITDADDEFSESFPFNQNQSEAATKFHSGADSFSPYPRSTPAYTEKETPGGPQGISRLDNDKPRVPQTNIENDLMLSADTTKDIGLSKFKDKIPKSRTSNEEPNELEEIGDDSYAPAFAPSTPPDNVLEETNPSVPNNLKYKVSPAPDEWNNDVPLIKEKIFPEFGRAPPTRLDDTLQSEVSGLSGRGDRQAPHKAQEYTPDELRMSGLGRNENQKAENLDTDALTNAQYPDPQVQSNRDTRTLFPSSYTSPYYSDTESESFPSRKPYEEHSQESPFSSQSRPATAPDLFSPTYSNASLHSNEDVKRFSPLQEPLPITGTGNINLSPNTPKQRDGKPLLVDDETITDPDNEWLESFPSDQYKDSTPYDSGDDSSPQILSSPQHADLLGDKHITESPVMSSSDRAQPDLIPEVDLRNSYAKPKSKQALPMSTKLDEEPKDFEKVGGSFPRSPIPLSSVPTEHTTNLPVSNNLKSNASMAHLGGKTSENESSETSQIDDRYSETPNHFDFANQSITSELNKKPSPNVNNKAKPPQKSSSQAPLKPAASKTSKKGDHHTQNPDKINKKSESAPQDHSSNGGKPPGNTPPPGKIEGKPTESAISRKRDRSTQAPEDYHDEPNITPENAFQEEEPTVNTEYPAAIVASVKADHDTQTTDDVGDQPIIAPQEKSLNVGEPPESTQSITDQVQPTESAISQKEDRHTQAPEDFYDKQIVTPESVSEESKPPVDQLHPTASETSQTGDRQTQAPEDFYDPPIITPQETSSVNVINERKTVFNPRIMPPWAEEFLATRCGKAASLSYIAGSQSITVGSVYANNNQGGGGAFGRSYCEEVLSKYMSSAQSDKSEKSDAGKGAPPTQKSNVTFAPPPPSAPPPVPEEEPGCCKCCCCIACCCLWDSWLIWVIMLIAALMLTYMIWWRDCGLEVLILEKITIWEAFPHKSTIRDIWGVEYAMRLFLSTLGYFLYFFIVCLCYVWCKTCALPNDPKSLCSCKEVKLVIHMVYGVVLFIFLYLAVTPWNDESKNKAKVKNLQKIEHVYECLELCMWYTAILFFTGVIVFLIYSLERRKIRQRIAPAPTSVENPPPPVQQQPQSSTKSDHRPPVTGQVPVLFNDNNTFSQSVLIRSLCADRVKPIFYSSPCPRPAQCQFGYCDFYAWNPSSTYSFANNTIKKPCSC